MHTCVCTWGLVATHSHLSPLTHTHTGGLQAKTEVSQYGPGAEPRTRKELLEEMIQRSKEQKALKRQKKEEQEDATDKMDEGGCGNVGCRVQV